MRASMCLEPKLEQSPWPRRTTKGSQGKLRSWNSTLQVEENKGKCSNRTRLGLARMENGGEVGRD